MIWLDRILSQTSFVDLKLLQEAEPKSPVLPGDKVVGVVPNEIKKLFGLMHFYRREQFRGEVTIASKLIKRETLMELMVEIFRAKRNADTIKEICSMELTEVFHLEDKAEVHVRKGWVVTWRESTNSELLKFVDEMSAGGKEKIM